MIDHQSSYLHRRRPVKTDFLTTQSTASVLDRQSYLRDSCSIRYLYSIIVLVLFHSFHGYMSDTYITAQHYDYTALEYMTAQHYDYTALIYDSTALRLYCAYMTAQHYSCCITVLFSYTTNHVQWSNCQDALLSNPISN